MEDIPQLREFPLTTENPFTAIAPRKSSFFENIGNALKRGVDTAKDTAWAIGVSIIFIAYPIAISVLDDRFILSKSKNLP